jgi:quercetin dioxygenase-like cupin family protein
VAIKRLTLIMVAAGLIAGMLAGLAVATPGSGVTSTTLGQGLLDPIKTKAEVGEWEVEIETKGQSNVTVVENRVAPGGHFGWHSHPGPSIVVVKSGTATFYRGDDPTCTPTEYEAGSAFADPVGGLVHIVRNEETEPLVVIVTRLLPPGVPARTDEPDPGNCPF